MTRELPGSQSRLQAGSVSQSVADSLRRLNLGDFAAVCVEAAAPLALVASQLLYAGAGFLGPSAMRLARFFESDDAMSQFLSRLTSDELVSARHRRRRRD